MAWLGMARHGMAGHGKARRGAAWQGKVFKDLTVNSILFLLAALAAADDRSGLLVISLGTVQGSQMAEFGVVGGLLPDDPAEITLRQAYELYLFPSIDGRRAKSTSQQYLTAIGHWEAFVGQRASTGSTRAPSVPFQVQPVDLVSQISDPMLSDWGAWLMADEGPQLSLASAGKQWKFVRAILRRVGPRGSGNPRAKGLLEHVPVMDPLEDLVDLAASAKGSRDVVEITDKQLCRLYRACDVAVWPKDDAVHQWKTLLVILSVMGPSVNEAATFLRDHFHLQAECPVLRSTRRHDPGWLAYVRTKTRRKKRGQIVVPLPACVRHHIDRLKTPGSALFSWSNSRNHSFRDQWRAIRSQAGLDQVLLANMRSTANIRWTRAGRGDDLGRWVLGHAARDTNDAHYMRHEADLIEAVPRLQLPEAFTAPLDGSAAQVFLF